MTRSDHPAVAVDVALVTIDDGHLAVVMLQRDQDPFRGAWQLPGGFVRSDESLDDAAARALREKAGIEGVYMEQLYTFGAVDRDRRQRVISVTYVALVEPATVSDVRGDVALAHIEYAGTGDPPTLVVGGAPVVVAFDHADIVGVVVERLRGKLAYVPIGYELLPDRFTLRDLQRVHQTILGRELNKDSFRRTMLASGELEPTGERQTDVGHRPAALYRHVSPGEVVRPSDQPDSP